jgi:hypothetical protein
MINAFYLGAYWKSRLRTVRQYVAESKSFFRRLQMLHPAFQTLITSEKRRGPPVALLPDLSNLEEVLLRRTFHQDAVFSHLDKEGNPTLDSASPLGFVTGYFSGEALGREKVGIMISAGSDSPWLGNAVVIDFPKEERAFREYGFVRQLLEAVVDCWAPDTAVVTSHSFNKRLDEQGGGEAIGWMNWFSEAGVRDALPEGIESEALGSGVLVVTAREPVSADAPEHVATARRIRDSLRARGLLQ